MNLQSSIQYLRRLRVAYKIRRKPKIFCVGANKTGTTSLKQAMKELGYVVGLQRTAENLIDDWAKRDFRRIIKYCKSAEFFQDIPFSLDFTYVVMDHVFENSKFILTVRDSPEQWYNSLVRFHSEKWGENGEPPTKKQLQDGFYIYKGRPWHVNRLINKTPENDVYNKKMLIQRYVNHNEAIRDYFRYRSGDLLILNVADENAYTDLCNFLGVKEIRDSFPWKNRTSEIQ